VFGGFSLNKADSDFLAGKYNFFSDGQSGSILNQGNISVIPGGVVALIAPKVTNEGTITATSGDV
jgi:predicted phage tail protein